MEGKGRRRWLRVPSPAMIVACVALFVALGGTSYAAATLAANSVGTKQIKNLAVTNAKVKNETLTGGKVKNGTLGTSDLMDEAVTGDKIAAEAVNYTHMGNMPGARVQRLAATSVSSGSTAVLSWDTADYNQGVYNASQPSRLTAPFSGRYLIMASARWESNPNGRRTLALEVNGTEHQIARSNASALWATTASFNPEQTVQTMYYLNAGDYVEVWAYQDSGSSLALLTNVDNGVTFAMQWLSK